MDAGMRRFTGRLVRRISAPPSPPPTWVLQISMAKMLTLGPLAFACGPGSQDPMARTVADYLAGVCLRYEGSYLERFLDAWRPATLGEVVDVNGAGSEPLRLPARGHLPPSPWRGGSVRVSARTERREFRTTAERIGAKGSSCYGSIYYGPATSEFGQITFARLVEVAASIDQHGYIPGEGSNAHIEGYLLVRQRDYRFMVVSGKHRVAALTALGYDIVPVLIGRKSPVVVDPVEASNWPNVRNGTFTQAQAVAMFDRVFDGRQPSALRTIAALRDEPGDGAD
jgi:hypothetical protein